MSASVADLIIALKGDKHLCCLQDIYGLAAMIWGSDLARSRRALILLVVGVAIFVAYLALFNPFAAFAKTHFDAPTYLLAIAIDYVGLLAFTTSWYTIVALLDIGIGPIEAIKVMFTSMFVGWLAPIPLNTEIVRAYLIRGKRNSNMAKAVASVIVHRAFYNLAFGAIIGFTTFFVDISQPWCYPHPVAGRRLPAYVCSCQRSSLQSSPQPEDPESDL